MLSAKRLVLDFKNRSEQGPPRERVAPEYLDKSETVQIGQIAAKKSIIIDKNAIDSPDYDLTKSVQETVIEKLIDL